MVSCLNKKAKAQQPIPICGNTLDENPYVGSPAIFKAKCNTCHLFDRESTGPKMEKALEHLPSEKWLVDFLRNEDSLIKIKDEYTTYLNKKYALHNCHNDSSLTKIQIQEIIDYIKE